MKLSNKDILDNVQNLGTLLQDEVPLPASVSYAVIRNYKILSPIADDIYQERSKIIQTYGTKINDEEYEIPGDKIEIVNKQLNDLLSINTSAPLVTFTIDNLQGYDIPLKVMNSLYFMVEDGEV